MSQILNFQLEGYDPSKATDAQLADDWRLVCAKYATMVAGGKTEFENVADCQQFANNLLTEILSRGRLTFHPDKMKPTSLDLLRASLESLVKGGIYLVPPHGELIYHGKKTAIVKSRNFARCQQFNILCSGDHAYGFARFKPPRVIPVPALAELRDLHQISDEEREKWWPDATKLYFYQLRDFVPFKGPRPFKLPRGVQTFIDEVQFGNSPREGRLAELSSLAATLPDFVWVPDFVSITGSTIFAERDPHDMDVVIRADKVDTLLSVKLDRVLRQLFQRPPHLILERAGPNWPFLPIYDLVLRRKHAPQVVPINEPEFEQRLYHQRAAPPLIAAAAEQSRRDDALEPDRFYLPMKPTRITLAGERQTVKRFVSYFQEDDFPVLNSKKYDGMHLLIFKDGDQLMIFSEDGSLIDNRRLPTIVEALQSLNPDLDAFILEGELEQWLGDVHQPREAVAGKLHQTEIEPDDDLILNLFTCLYINGEDLHKETEEMRQIALRSIGVTYSTNDVPDLSHKLNLVPNNVCKNSSELERSTEKLRFVAASEGVVAKKASSVYYLDGNSREGWIKFHNNAVLTGKVIEAIETKTAGVFNYRYGILPGEFSFKPGDLAEVGDEELVEVGKTFSTSIECSRGELIQVEFETFNLVHHLDTDDYEVSAWAPVFLRRVDSRGSPDVLEDVIAAAEKEHILQRKEITEEGEIVYL